MGLQTQNCGGTSDVVKRCQILTTEEIVDNWIGGAVGIYKPVWEGEPGIDSLSVVCILKSAKYSVGGQKHKNATIKNSFLHFE